MTLHKYLRENVRSISFISFVLVLISFSFFTISCADNPTSLGLKFLPPGDTVGVRVFDSYKDTMNIYSANHRKNINTSSSGNLIVGQKDNYSSKALIKFTNLPGNYDSSVVNSAILKLWYRNYYFPVSTADSLAQISFNIYTVQQYHVYDSLTLDSVNSSSWGTTLEGSYTGSPKKDSTEIDIPLDNTLVQNWLANAQEPSHGSPNYGIVLLPNSSSQVLKGFYSSALGLGLPYKPTLEVILTKNGHTDTLNFSNSQNLSLADASFQAGSPTFILQAGVSYVQVLKFDVSKIPSTATINDVELFLTIDSANSIFTNQTSYNISSYYRDDTTLTGYQTSSLISGSQYSGNPAQYLFRIIYPFQRWVQGQANYGIILNAYNQTSNLDKFVFYDVNASDPNKKPRVIIKYTPRKP